MVQVYVYVIVERIKLTNVIFVGKSSNNVPDKNSIMNSVRRRVSEGTFRAVDNKMRCTQSTSGQRIENEDGNKLLRSYRCRVHGPEKPNLRRFIL